MIWLQRCKPLLVHQRVPMADKFSLMVLLEDDCLRSLQSARFASTPIHFPLNMIGSALDASRFLPSQELTSFAVRSHLISTRADSIPAIRLLPPGHRMSNASTAATWVDHFHRRRRPSLSISTSEISMTKRSLMQPIP